MPLLESDSVEAIVWPGVVFGAGRTLLQGPGVPAATFETPRGTNMKGTLSVCWSAAWPEAGVATMAPRTVKTPPAPITNVESDSSAAKDAAGMDSET